MLFSYFNLLKLLCIKNIIRKEYEVGNSLLLKAQSFWGFFLNSMLETPKRMDYIGNVVSISYRDTLPSTASTSACSFAGIKLEKLDFPVLAFSGCLRIWILKPKVEYG